AVLGVLPLFHALAQMANLLIPLAVGARVVFLETVNSTSLLAALQTRGITIFACVPQFFYLIHQRVTGEVAKRGVVSRWIFRGMVAATTWLRDRTGVNPGPRLFARVHSALGPRMRMLVTGGSRFDPAIGRDLYGMGFTLLNAYGLTECSGGATVVRPGDRFTTSVGQAFPGVELRIAADGEILIRGPIVMREYFNRPDATAEALKDGWLFTGDLGSLDADGRLFITGRKKEIIVLASGKNLYPEEIEAHYRQSPFIKELCVLGLTRPGEPSSERLHAVIVPDEDALRARGVVNVRELIRFELEGLSVKLPAHKRILSYDIWLEPLPRTTTGKIKRHEVERRVRERAVTDTAAARPTSDAENAWLADSERAALTATIARRLDKAVVRPDDNLELDLALDSMERVELLTALEQQRGTRVAADVRATIFTVRQLVDAVIAGLPSVAGAQDSPAPAKEGVSTSQAWESLLAAPPARDIVDNLSKSKLIRAAVLYMMIRGLGVVARLWFGFRVTGREHVPARGPFIVCPNHQAYIDGFFLAAALPFRAFRDIFFVGAAEYFETPFMAWLARAINIVPVDPDANLVNAMRAGAAGLRLGKVLILFPEGERSIDGEIKRFRKGAAILSAHTGEPIVPVALAGLFEIWPRGRSFQWKMLLPWRAPRVRLAFGPPLLPDTDYARATDALESKVGELFRPIH
ncbi:MAG TPA: 1-acyl-sn-glycerol-3-phosphate acyltransferase, partial [Vicinamibacterales bacterium]|nr:1-acyl-sn-glycerol-3-phosphate acyltransferase [Vicinamibacterales bacterium]